MEQQNNEQLQQLQQQLTARLTTIMQAKNITPTMLANDLGLNPSNVTGFLQGKKNPTLLTMQRLALALDVPLWMLITTPDAIITDLQQMGLMPDTVPSNSVAREDDAPQQESPAQSAESPQDAPDVADLITVNPTTGEAHRYRLIS